MIPQIDYQNHEILNRLFMPPSKKKTDFHRQKKEFVNHFKKIEKEALKLIEQFSGFKWSKKKIPVYLIPNGMTFSFTKSNLERNTPGVVQKIYETKERSTHIFIHELSHVNQFQSDFFSKKNSFVFNKKGLKDRMKLEICTEVICLHVIRTLFGKNSRYEKDYWNFQKKIMTSTPGKEKKIPEYVKKWDLNKKDLRFYIFKK